MKRFQTDFSENIFIFRDLKNNKTLKVKHEDNIHICDILIIDESYDIMFVKYIIKTLKKTNDILVVDVLFNDLLYEKMFHENNFKISYLQYEIPYQKYDIKNTYEISNNFCKSSEQYYLKHYNEIGFKNNKYFSPTKTFTNIKNINMNYFRYSNILIYSENKKIIGIVDYNIFEEDNNVCNNKIYNVSNRIVIKSLFADDEGKMELILKDLFNRYNKNIIISFQYTYLELKNAIESLDGKLKFISYINKDLSDYIEQIDN